MSVENMVKETVTDLLLMLSYKCRPDMDTVLGVGGLDLDEYDALDLEISLWEELFVDIDTNDIEKMFKENNTVSDLITFVQKKYDAQNNVVSVGGYI